MKTKNLMFLGLIFILLFSLSFSVLAQRDTKTAAEAATVNIADSINKALDWVFNVSFVDWDVMLITLAVFLVLFIVFSDALINFSPLSRNAALGVGFLLALIAALLDIPFTIAIYALGITAAFGVIAVGASLILVFLAYVVFHILIFKGVLGHWKNPEKITLKRTTLGAKYLEDVGTFVEKEGKKKVK